MKISFKFITNITHKLGGFGIVLRTLLSTAIFVFPAVPSTAQISGVRSNNFKKVCEPRMKEVGFSINEKATRTIETPWGPRKVYDPFQDIEAKQAFESLYDWARLDTYFQTRPANMRTEHDISRYKEISERQDTSYIRVANRVSINQLHDLGCQVVGTRSCKLYEPTFWRGCDVNKINHSSFSSEMVGDPMRGSGALETQFKMFFETSCNYWEEKEK